MPGDLLVPLVDVQLKLGRLHLYIISHVKVSTGFLSPVLVSDCDIRSRNAAAPPLRNPALSAWGLSVRHVLHLFVTRVISNDLK